MSTVRAILTGRTVIGAFTVGISQVEATEAYIRNQERHHTKRSFAEEWATFMKRHGLEVE